MKPILLKRDDLRVGHLISLAVAPDGRRVYVGRNVSDD